MKLTINEMFNEITDVEKMEIDGGNFFKDLGYFAHAWCDFWGSLGEGVYDGTH